MKSIVWMSEPLARALGQRLSHKPTLARSMQEFLEAPRDAQTVSFVDRSAIEALDQHAKQLRGPAGDVVPPEWRRLVAAVSVGQVIAICSEPIETAIGLLQPHPWLSHVVSATTLELETAESHLRHVMKTATAKATPRLLDWLGPDIAGRRIRLTHASRGVERLGRMCEFFNSKGVGSGTTELVRGVAEELLSNAFYDAPVAAGALKGPISRTQDIALPDDSACDLAYGCREDLAIVHVRDPFGSLSRRRLVEVLTRCALGDRQQVDNTMGGKGQGLWRIFSIASFVAISVIQHRHTEVLIGIEDRQASDPQPFAFHFFFKEGGQRMFWKMIDEATGDPTMNASVTIRSE